MNSDVDVKRDGLLLGAGLAAGTAVSLLLTARRDEEPALPDAARWQDVLAAHYGPVDAALLIARMQARYRELFAERPHFDHKALRWHLENSILPGVAAYQVLWDASDDQAEALAVFDHLLEASLQESPVRWQMKLLANLPRQFGVFRWVVRRTMQAQYPREGWLLTWLEDNEERISFNVHRCFYLDLLTEYGVPELTAHFCRGDDLLFAQLPPEIRWERTETLGCGGRCCNFAWRHVPEEATNGR